MLNALLLAALAQTGTIDTPPTGHVCASELVAFQQQVPPAPAEDSTQSAQQKRHEEDLKNDTEAGKKYSKEVDEKYKPSTNQEIIKRVQRIGAEIAAIANRTHADVTWGDKRLNNFDYSFKVVQGKDVNAFSLPGGYIYVYEGLVEYCESDDELAGVMAHEIAHAAFRHVATLQKEANRLQTISIPLVLAAILTGGASTGISVLQGSQIVGQAFLSGWSVEAERSADWGGLQYILQSRYDPSGMVTIQERLARDEKSRPKIDWGIYQTHPPSRERVSNLTAKMEKQSVPVRRSAVTTTFRTQVKPEKDGVEIWFNGRKLYTFAGSSAQKRAEDAAVRLDSFFDSVPEMFQVKAADGVVLGEKRRLIEVSPEDAAAAKTSVENLTNTTAKQIRGSLYLLAYRVWDAR
jgi:beta-barrel assembly-enhancing protease